MRIVSRCVSVAIAVVLMPITSDADNGWIFAPRAEIGHIEYSGDFSGVFFLPLGPSGSLVMVPFSNGYTTSFRALRLGVTVAKGRGYVDVYSQTSDKSGDSLLLAGVVDDSVSKREELVMVAGYRIYGPTNLFVGFRESNSHTDTSSGNTVEIDSDAYFLGVSVTQPISDKASIGANGAYVAIDRVSYAFQSPAFPGRINLMGDGSGWKVGVNYRAVLLKQLNLMVGADYYNYNWDATDTSANRIEGDEGELSLRIGVTYLF